MVETMLSQTGGKKNLVESEYLSKLIIMYETFPHNFPPFEFPNLY